MLCFAARASSFERRSPILFFFRPCEKSSLRLRVKKAGAELARIFEEIQKKAENPESTGAGASPFAEITDDDIDNLFSD